MPNSFTDVNFIPDEVVSSRKHATQLKSLNKIAIGSMILSLLVGFGILGYNTYIGGKVKAIQSEVVSQQAKIQSLNEFAETGYKLGGRLSTIKSILDSRIYHWKIIRQIYAEVPGGITIDNITMDDNGNLSLSGSSFPNYIPIAVFQDNLKGSESLYFSDIRLRSASLDKTAGNITFSLDLLVDSTKTYEPIQ